MLQQGQAPAAHSPAWPWPHRARPTSYPVTTAWVIPWQWPCVTGIFLHAFCSRWCPLLIGFHDHLSTHVSKYTYWESNHVYEIWDKAYRSIIYCNSKFSSYLPVLQSTFLLPFPSGLMSAGKNRRWGWSEAAVNQGMTGKSISGINFSMFHIKSLRNHTNLLLYTYFVDG